VTKHLRKNLKRTSCFGSQLQRFHSIVILLHCDGSGVRHIAAAEPVAEKAAHSMEARKQREVKGLVKRIYSSEACPLRGRNDPNNVCTCE
jgi:hypothetical protein